MTSAPSDNPPWVTWPYTPDKGRLESRDAIFNAGRLFDDVDVSSMYHLDYVGLFQHLWRREQSFMIVEHDVVGERRHFDAIDDCPEEWCTHPYNIMGKLVGTGLGFTRFRSSLIRRHPALPEQIATMGVLKRVPTTWEHLDMMVDRYLTLVGEKRHVHPDPVQHLHVYPELPQAAT